MEHLLDPLTSMRPSGTGELEGGSGRPHSAAMGSQPLQVSQDFQKLLACPRCHGGFAERPERERWTCQSCGLVGRLTLGLPDFLSDCALALAAGGVMDLEADEARAAGLEAQAAQNSVEKLRQIAVELQEGDQSSKTLPASIRRFNARYFRIEAEIGLRAGRAILDKVNSHLAERGRPALRGRWALEAGGAQGLFLPDFAQVFEGVVLLDCCLVQLVLARKAADELGLANVAFVRGDVLALPLRSGVFDFVHENNVVEHVADPASMVREALRVTAMSGTYVCVSPNRFTLTPEPHFRLAGFGFLPPRLRRPLIRFLRGVSSEAGTAPLSLFRLKGYLRLAGVRDPAVFFLPRRLSTARDTLLRRAVRLFLSLPVLGRLLSWAINGPLLWLMPYHVAVARKNGHGECRDVGCAALLCRRTKRG